LRQPVTDLPAPFVIGSQGVTIQSDPAPWREQFTRAQALGIAGAIEPGLCAKLIERTARSQFVADEDVGAIGTRLVEAPQLIGKAISLLLHAPELLRWLEAVTAAGPLCAVAGRFAEMRASHNDALDWHDDFHDIRRRLAVIINLSDRPYCGGQFQLRRKGEQELLLSYDHPAPGSLLLVAVKRELEHCVTPVSEGGPRRIYAGWFMTHPEHESGALRSSG
jgi:2OG-Fe(II) oxygenase superfamily